MMTSLINYDYVTTCLTDQKKIHAVYIFTLWASTSIFIITSITRVSNFYPLSQYQGNTGLWSVLQIQICIIGMIVTSISNI
jgi:hypothetical protein